MHDRPRTGPADMRRDPPVYQTLKQLYEEDAHVSVPGDALHHPYPGEDDEVAGVFEEAIQDRLEQQQDDLGHDRADRYPPGRGVIRSTAWGHDAIDIYQVSTDDSDSPTWLYVLDGDALP